VKGTYNIYVDGKLCSYKNVITVAGKESILSAVAGNSAGFATSIVAGIGDVTATVNDTSLEFLVGGNDITTVMVDPINEKIFFKATLPAQDNYEVHELGCFSINYTGAQNSINGGSIILITFGESTTWFDTEGTSTFEGSNNRIGLKSIEYSGFTTVEGYADLVQDLSHLGDSTTFDLAYYSEGVSDLELRFNTDEDNYYSTNSWTVDDGYNIDKIAVGSFTATGVPDWAFIRTVSIVANGTDATLSLDALRYTIPSATEASDSTLLSRVVLTEPQQKLAGVSMDLEYVLELDL